MSETVQIPVSNMSCAVCAQRVEKALGQVPGVEQAAVNFATEKAQVTFDPAAVSVATLVDAVRSAGYEVPAVTATFPVTGMNCAACSGRVERTVQGLPGVVRAAVNLATERVTVTYLPDVITPGGIARAVESAGYRMLVGDDGAAPAEPGAAAEEERRRTVSRIRLKFIVSLVVGAILMLMMLIPESWLGMKNQWYIMFVLATPDPVLGGGAVLPRRLGGAQASHQRHEHPHRRGDLGGLPVLGGGDVLPRRVRKRRRGGFQGRGLLRLGGDHHRAHPAGPLAGGAGEGADVGRHEATGGSAGQDGPGGAAGAGRGGCRGCRRGGGAGAPGAQPGARPTPRPRGRGGGACPVAAAAPEWRLRAGHPPAGGARTAPPSR